MIPFVNLRRQHAEIGLSLRLAIDRVLERQVFLKGPETQGFAEAWLAALGAAHGACCSNGTAALELALEALGIGRGDEVITTAHSFFATAEAILRVGATPVFADIDPRDYTIDIATARVGARTRAIVPVHIYGTPCDMDAIADFAAAHDLKVVEDAAQAHLATWADRACGTFGDAGCFSFYPGKNLGALGDAGFVVARDPAVAARIGKLLDHGRRSKYVHDVAGANERIDEIQAAALRVKLQFLPAWTATRRAHAALYDARLRAAGFKTVAPRQAAAPSRHLYVVEVANRDAVQAALKAQGIETGVHYPVPLHRQPALAQLPAVDLPVTERCAARLLSLPICGAITPGEIERVCEAFLAVAAP